MSDSARAVRPVEVAELRTSLVDYLSRPDQRANFGLWLRHLYEPDATEPDVYEADFQLETLRRARLYLVSEDMGRLVAVAAPSLPLFDLDHEDVPADDALVVFDPPLDIPLTVSGKERAIAAFSWSVMQTPDTGKPGVAAVLWGKRDAFDGRGVPLGDAVPPLIPHWCAMWWFHERWQPNGEGNYQSWPAYIGTFWRLLGEPYVAMERARPERAASRRAQRARVVDPTVRVLTLRRPKGTASSDGIHEVEWSRRWIVQGHWRQQWYPSQGRHAPRWIRSYVKGPEDKPLVAPPTVNVWSR